MSGARRAGDLRTLVWVDRKGEEIPIGMTPRAYGQPQLSPDGRQVVVDGGGLTGDLFLFDLETGVDKRFTFDAGGGLFSIWSPDGRQIVFSSIRDQPAPTLYVKSADGSGTADRLPATTGPLAATDWADAGETLIVGGGRHSDAADW